VRPADRVEAIDVVRGIALFGVMAINLLSEFRESIFQQFLPPPGEPHEVDRLTDLFAQYGLDMKAFSLFSLLFGVGLAIQYDRLARSGPPLRWLRRRLVILLGFGLIHCLLIWNGDILIEYALAGFVVLPFLMAPRWLVGVAACACLMFYVAMPYLALPFPWYPPGWFQQHVAVANLIYGQGTFLQVHRFNFREAADIVPLHVSVFPRTVGLFLLGAFSWRKGLFSNPAAHRRAISAIALAATIAGALLTYANETHLASAVLGWPRLGNSIDHAAPAVLALGYCSVFVWLMEFTAARRVLRIFAPLGRMAFSNYIAESLLFGLSFYGFGFGLYGRIGSAATLAIGTGVYALQLAASAWWLRHHRFGPLEWLWRTLMYGKRQPMAQIQ
jgi:uncharacterized protein